MNNKFIKYLLVFLFISFAIIFVSNQTGYYEYSNNKKNVFTEEKIKEFEKDISEGKNVNIKDYLTEETRDYSNNITSFGDGISKLITDSVNTFLKESFNLMQKIVD